MPVLNPFHNLGLGLGLVSNNLVPMPLARSNYFTRIFLNLIETLFSCSGLQEVQREAVRTLHCLPLERIAMLVFGQLGKVLHDRCQ